MDFTIKEKIAILSTLTLIMKADGIEDPQEQSFMEIIRQRLDIDKNLIGYLKPMELDDCKSILKELSEEKKEFVNKCFLDMVGVDGKVDLRELQVLHMIMN